MHRLRRFLYHTVLTLVAVAALGVGARATAPDPTEIAGLWLSSKEEVVIELYPCDDRLCGSIVWLAKPYRKSGEFKRDARNPDKSLRNRGWCGIRVVRGLKGNGADSWTDGKFYYPKQGRTYDLNIAKVSNDEIQFRAYLGIPLLGKTEVWTRAVPGQEVGCVPEPPPSN